MDLSSSGTAAFGGNMGTANGALAKTGPDLQEISTEALGFQSIAGDAKLRLLPAPWPSQKLPPPTASLLSVASRKGLLAAAGPTSVVIASTESVRQAFSTGNTIEGNVKSFTPQLTLEIGTRLSQVYFSADEEFLILSAEEGGGLAVYEVQSLMNGSTQASFELSTNGSSLRALIPNPSIEKAELLCLVSTKGELMMANLKTRQFVSGNQGTVLRQGVSCVSWSPKGKQFVAGQGNGLCIQATPEGEVKGELPRPSNLEGDQHVSSIFWLETNLFLVIYTPSSSEPGMPPQSTYTLVTRAPNQKELNFQNLPEPCPPFIPDRSSPYQYMLRLKDYPPNLSDAIIVASTVSTDIGLLTRSKSPLTNEVESSEQITNVFTTTAMADDSRRAQLPMSESMTEGSSDTSPIGIALDLSSKEKISRPLPKEEFTESPGPLPGLMVLNNEGTLTMWWLVYAESIRQGTIYPDLAVVGGNQMQQTPRNQQQASSFASLPTNQTPTSSGQNAFAQSSNPFNNPVSNAPAPAFGTTSPASGFGSSSALGRQSSPWGAQANKNTQSSGGGSSFGTPAFGASTPLGMQGQGSSFGMTTGLGNRASPWSSTSGAGQSGTSGSVFGQPSGLAQPSSAFKSGTWPTTAPNQASSGFAAFAAKPSGFAASSIPPTGSVFGAAASSNVFGPTAPSNLSLGSQLPKQETNSKPAFGQDAFVLGSTFKSDGSSANDGPKAATAGAGSLFGSTFGETLTQARQEPTQQKDAEMDDDMEEDRSQEPVVQNASGPGGRDINTGTFSSTPFNSTPPISGGLFGTQAQTPVTPAKVQSSLPAAPTTEAQTPESTTPRDASKTPRNVPPVSTSPKIKQEPESSEDGISPLNADEAQPPEGFGEEKAKRPEPQHKEAETSDVSKDRSDEAPLPPESTSKATFAPGDSSNSSKSSAEEQQEPAPSTEPAPSKSKLNIVESAPAERDAPSEQGYDHETEKEGENEKDNETRDTDKALQLNVGEENPPEEGTKADSLEDEEEGTEEEYDEEEEDDDDADDDRERQDKVGREEGTEEAEEDDEGSGIDVAREISSPSDTNHTGQSLKISPESSFGAPKSPIGGLFSKVQPKDNSSGERPLFGEVGKSAETFFPPPNKTQESPRSPSPVRQSQISRLGAEALRPDSSRSLSAPGPFSNVVNRKIAMSQISVPSSQPQQSVAELRRYEEHNTAAANARKKAEEEQILDEGDDEDEIRRELAADVIGRRTLDPFLAHQDYVGHIDKAGVPGQIEKVYRDINSMIDTLGLNARSVASFIKGHSEHGPDQHRSIADLDYEDRWSLGEIPDLISIESSLGEELESHNYQDLRQIRSLCRDIRSDIAFLYHRRSDLTKAIEKQKNSQSTESSLQSPLTLEQSSQQQDLRQKFMKYQALLATAEESLTVLRAKIVACDTVQGQSNGSHLSRQRQTTQQPTQKPTAEAVTKTILKMTSMIEKKSGDIDVLEAQLRSLRFGSPASSRPQSRHSREGTPNLFRSSPSPSGKRGNSLSTTNPLSRSIAAKSSPLRQSLITNPQTPMSGKAFSNPHKQSVGRRWPQQDAYGEDGDDDDANDEDEDADSEDAEERMMQQRIREKAKRRKEINLLLKDVFEKQGPRISTL